MDIQTSKYDDKLVKYHRAVVLDHRAKAMKLGLAELAERDNSMLSLIDSGVYTIDMLEYLNHSLYKPTFEIDLADYISDDKKAFERFKQTFIDAYEGKLSLLISDTGTGKGVATFKALNELTEYGIKAIIVLPNASIVEQMGVKNQVPYIFGKNRKLDDYIGKANIIVATWDKVAQSRHEGLRDYILIRDEAHELKASDFRKDVVRPLETMSSMMFRGVVDITATANRLDFEAYNSIVKFRNVSPQQVNVTMYDGISDDKILEILSDESKKFSVLINNKNRLAHLKRKINRKVGIIHSDIKESSEIYKQLVENSCLGDFDGMLNTTCILTGFNIEGEKEVHAIVEGIKDPQKLKQFPVRFRGAKINYHIFNNYSKEKYFTYLNSEIERAIEDTQDTADYFNSKYVDENGDIYENRGLNLNESNALYYCDRQCKYVVDKAQVRANIYDNYYKSRSLAQLKELLSEYFSDIKVVSLNEKEKDLTEYNNATKDMREECDKLIVQLEGQKDNLIASVPLITGSKLSDNEKHSLAMIGKSQDDLMTYYRMSGLTEKMDNILLVDFLNKFSNYHTDENYDLDFSYALAKLSESKKDDVIEAINVLKYRTVTETQPKKRKTLEDRQIQFMLDELPIGTKYGKEQLEELTKRFNAKFKTKYKVAKIRKFIQNIFVLNEKRTKATKSDAKLYRRFSSEKKDARFNVNQVIGYVAVEDIAKQLGVDATNITLNKLLKH